MQAAARTDATRVSPEHEEQWEVITCDDVSPEPVAASAIDESLVSASAAMAATGGLSQLVNAINDTHDTSLQTFQEMVKNVMRPMIKEWLDANLPDLVERVVTREVQRLARRAEDD